jgi:hypothetical protein
MFRDLYSTRLSQFNSDTEKFVPDGSKNAHRWTQGKETVTDWLNGLAADFYDEGIVKLVQRVDKCLKSNVHYVEKYTYVASSGDIKIIWTNMISFVYNKTVLTLKMILVYTAFCPHSVSVCSVWFLQSKQWLFP